MSLGEVIYLDTSFIAAPYLNEANSSAIDSTLQNLPPDSLFISEWTRTEIASLLARRIRMKELSEVATRAVLSAFEEDIKDVFQVIVPTTADFQLASTLILTRPGLGLRGPDALHLALAVRHNLTLYSLDKTFVQASISLGYPASSAGVLN